MLRRRRTPSLFRQIAFLLVVPLAFSSVGYALFTQNLALNTTSAKPSYSANQSIYLTYTSTVTPQSSQWLYALAMTVTNQATVATASWQAKFDVPADTTQLTCPSTVTCTRSVNTVTINSTAANSSLNASGTAVFTISFVTAVPKYVLQNVYTSATQAIFAPISGLTVAQTIGKRSKFGSGFRWPITYVVTNNSGRTLSTWRIVVSPWGTANSNTVVSAPTGVTYATTATELLISRVAAIANGTNYSFTISLSASNNSWVPTATVEGM